MYDEQLEELIEVAIDDGVLTDTERRVLEKRAAEFDCDIDEFNMILEARLRKRQRELGQSQCGSKPATVKMGNIKRCPHCNAVVPPGKVRCEECGYEFRDVEAVSSVVKLQDALDKIIMYGGNEAKVEKAQAKTILNFPVPNAKEDLLEFTMVAMGRGDKYNKNDDDTVGGAYYKKFRECYEKVKMFYADDPLFAPIVEEARKRKWRPSLLVRFLIGFIVFEGIIWLIVLICD